jgi:hypothetical protein
MQLNPHKLGISCEFDQPNGTYSVKDIVSGKIVIQPYQDIYYNSYGYRVIWAIKNRNSSKKDEIVVLRKPWSDTVGVWKKFEKVEYSFKFRPAVPPSFKGKFFSIEWQVVLETELRGSSRSLYKKAANRYLDFNKMIFPTNKVSFHFPLEISSVDVPFRVKPRKENFLLDSDVMSYGIVAGVGLMGVIFNWQDFFNFALPIFEIVGSGAIGMGVFNTFVGFAKLKELNVSTRHAANDTCEIEIEIIRNWSSAKMVSFRYFALEEYDQGDSENSVAKSSYLHNYQSQGFPIEGQITRIVLPLPPKDKGLPASFNVHPYMVSWNLEVTLILKNGREKTFTYHFPLGI